MTRLLIIKKLTGGDESKVAAYSITQSIKHEVYIKHIRQSIQMFCTYVPIRKFDRASSFSDSPD